jgi:hypothetical protein
VPGFDMPVRVMTSPDSSTRLSPTEAWQTTTLPIAHSSDFRVDENYFVVVRQVNNP